MIKSVVMWLHILVVSLLMSVCRTVPEQRDIHTSKWTLLSYSHSMLLIVISKLYQISVKLWVVLLAAVACARQPVKMALCVEVICICVCIEGNKSRWSFRVKTYITVHYKLYLMQVNMKLNNKGGTTTAIWAWKFDFTKTGRKKNWASKGEIFEVSCRI
jgi:hypothetical protein